MATVNSGRKLPSRPAPTVPNKKTTTQIKPERSDWPPDPFSPPRMKTDPQDRRKAPPPRPPPPRINENQEKNHFRSIFGSTKRNSKKKTVTAIVKPLPQAPAQTPVIPTGTLIDLQTPPGSPKSQKNLDSIWSISSSTKSSSAVESGFEDDFSSLMSSRATTPGMDFLSDLSPEKPSFQAQPLKTVAVPSVQSKPTIICVPKAKPSRPPPPQLDGSPPMPNMPPPPPPPELLQVLTQGPPLPPRPPFSYEPKDNSGPPTCTALYDYESSHPDDLTFKAGDEITLIRTENEEWLRGRNRGCEGIFPANYVKINNAGKRKPLMTAIALFPYNPASWDDLELQEGDEIVVLDRVNKDWLYGDCLGRKGMFPASYVQDISYLTDSD